MPVSAVSRYRGGTVEDVTHLAKTMKAVLLKHGVAYRLSRFQTGQNVGEWIVVVQYADWMTYAKAQDSFAQDPDHSHRDLEGRDADQPRIGRGPRSPIQSLH
jgi:hypothetical protein